jgi:hypothetical protein
MPFEIKCWYDESRVIYRSETATTLEEAIFEAVAAKASLQSAKLQYAKLQSANLQDANLQDAKLQYANLQYANLQSAKLQSANLQYANLQYANLQSAKLQYAKLQSANLQDAKLLNVQGLMPLAFQPLQLLKFQPGPIRMFKMVSEEYMSPVQNRNKLRYQIGDQLEVLDADTNPQNDCAAGINVATLDWLYREYHSEIFDENRRLVEVEFTATDIACIPHASNGKIRVFRCKVVAEHDWREIGLFPPKEEKKEE